MNRTSIFPRNVLCHAIGRQEVGITSRSRHSLSPFHALDAVSNVNARGLKGLSHKKIDLKSFICSLILFFHLIFGCSACGMYERLSFQDVFIGFCLAC